MFTEKLKQRLQAVAQEAQAQIEYINSDDANQRMEICRNCEFLWKTVNQCQKCGCFMNLKTKLVNAKCPIGKW